MSGNATGNHGFRLRPVLFNKEGKVDVINEAGYQRGREEAMEKPVVKDEIPAQAEE